MHALMFLLLKKNIFQLCFCTEVNESISINSLLSNPLRILWHMVHLQWSVECWVWPYGYFSAEESAASLSPQESQ